MVEIRKKVLISGKSVIYNGQISVNIADIIDTDILHRYLGKRPITDVCNPDISGY
ncbi:hypothetical protein Hanom_Chr16g01512891 [Helianthus anomalus]